MAQLFPPSPIFTEKNISSLEGKVFIVNGGNAGVGLELSSRFSTPKAAPSTLPAAFPRKPLLESGL